MPSTIISEAKAALRRQVRGHLAALDARARRQSDDALFARFLSLPQLAKARTVLLFYGMGSEPDTARLIPQVLALGKRAALPRCLPGHGMEARLWDGAQPLVRHPYGMWEPGEACPILPKTELDLILVPGVCYDQSGFRLGQGGGFYDRYLSDFSGVTVGLCRDGVLQHQLPREVHDLPVHLVVTESRTWKTRPPEGGPVFTAG